jgi:hypothetical protein
MNEKGFMFPVSLCILLLFSIFLTVHFHQYMMERGYLTEVEQFERNQFYFLQSLKKVERLMREESFDYTGSFVYEKGTVTYKITELGESLFQIKFDLTTTHQSGATGTGFYDADLQKMIKWIERN